MDFAVNTLEVGCYVDPPVSDPFGPQLHSHPTAPVTVTDAWILMTIGH